MGKTTPFFDVINLQTPRFSPKCLSPIEENSPNEKNVSPQRMGEENEGHEFLLGHQLKKILTEDKQLPSYQNRCDTFSFQGKLSKSSNSSQEDKMGVVVEIKENENKIKEETNISATLPFEIKEKHIEEKNKEEAKKSKQETKVNDGKIIDGIKGKITHSIINLINLVKKTNKNEKTEITSENKIPEAKPLKTPKKKIGNEKFLTEQKVPKDNTYFYGYSQKKAIKPVCDKFNIEKIIAPVKISNRKSENNAFSTSLILKKTQNIYILIFKSQKGGHSGYFQNTLYTRR